MGERRRGGLRCRRPGLAKRREAAAPDGLLQRFVGEAHDDLLADCGHLARALRDILVRLERGFFERDLGAEVAADIGAKIVGRGAKPVDRAVVALLAVEGAAHGGREQAALERDAEVGRPVFVALHVSHVDKGDAGKGSVHKRMRLKGGGLLLTASPPGGGLKSQAPRRVLRGLTFAPRNFFNFWGRVSTRPSWGSFVD